MNKFSKSISSLTCISLIALAGCASTKPVAYANLNSAAQLQPSSQDDADKTPYVYSPSVNWSNYSAVVLEPVAIYNGPDHQFGDLPEADKQELARYMEATFRKTLSQRFRVATGTGAGPNTLKLKLTLAGAGTNTAVASTVTRFDLAGMPYNVVQSVRGKEGIFMGSVSYSVEVYDAANNKLLKAFVTKQYPNAMNVAATFGSLNAAKTGIEKGADALVAQLK